MPENQMKAFLRRRKADRRLYILIFHGEGSRSERQNERLKAECGYMYCTASL